jgi:DNA polymerase-1
METTRTKTGLLSVEAAELTGMALGWPEVRPLVAVRKAEKLLSSFGQSLIDLIESSTKRLHGDYFLPTVTGRLSCRQPNLQQLTGEIKAAVIAPSGQLLICSDLRQIEMRIGAEVAGEQAMRRAFARGEDLRAKTAQTTICLAGGSFADLAEDERKRIRQKSKSSNFGAWYGIGSRSLRKKIWRDYALEISLEEAQAVLDAFHETYPAVRSYQQSQYREGRFDAVWSIAGRPRRAVWEREIRDPRTGRLLRQAGEMRYTDCCNHRIQSSAADVLLDAMVRIDRALPGTLVASVHDEVLLAVPERAADRAAEIVAEQMTAAFERWFPEGPTVDLVDVQIVEKWSDAK